MRLIRASSEADDASKTSYSLPSMSILRREFADQTAMQAAHFMEGNLSHGCNFERTSKVGRAAERIGETILSLGQSLL
jgi:hypothetical protein